MLFENRMGCLEEVVPEETEKFIFAVGEMFRLSPIIVLFPQSVWPYLPFWKQFVSAWDYLFKICEGLQRASQQKIIPHFHTVQKKGSLICGIKIPQDAFQMVCKTIYNVPELLSKQD